MTKLHEIYAKTLKNGDIGLECEVEFKKGFIPIESGVPECWVCHKDESLKNGMEYVSRQPFKVGPQYYQKIKSLTDILNHEQSGVDHNNARASWHVHINVLEKTPMQIWNAILTYWLLEPVLMKYCATHRLGNHFCLRLEDSPAMLKLCYKDLENFKPFVSFYAENCKYSSMNLATISDYGSLEFRGLHATYNPDEVNQWSTSLYHMVQVASSYDSPSAIMDRFIESSKDSFLYEFLPYDFANKLTTLDPSYATKGKQSKRLLASLAYFHDWSSWSANIKPAVKGVKVGASNYFHGNETSPLDLTFYNTSYVNAEIEED